MDGMLSLASRESAAAGDLWVEVFQQRGVWQLTREMVDRWVARNAVFFGMITRLVPHGSDLLELGCGPGRHALGSATLGYRVLGIDLDPQIVRQAQANADAVAPECGVAFQVGDMFGLDIVAPHRISRRSPMVASWSTSTRPRAFATRCARSWTSRRR